MLDIIAVALGAISMVLHFVAPRTKTKADDKALEVVDKAAKAVGAIKPLVTLKPPAPSKPVEGFGTARDHRTGK